MQYFIIRMDNGQVTVSIVVVTEWVSQYQVLTASMGMPRIDMLHEVKPVPQGTEINVTERRPEGEDLTKAQRARLRERLTGLANLIENDR